MDCDDHLENELGNESVDEFYPPAHNQRLLI